MLKADFHVNILDSKRGYYFASEAVIVRNRIFWFANLQLSDVLFTCIRRYILFGYILLSDNQKSSW